MNPSSTPVARPNRRRRSLLTVGVVAATLGAACAGAGTAMAVAPTSSLSRTVANALHGAGVDWSQMPDGYTQAQYEAYWGAGYTAADTDALSALWSTDATETKSQAGQLILDGATLPVSPGQYADAPQADGFTAAQASAFWGAGYTADDVTALSALWNSEYSETKARAGQMILDGQTPPVAPGSTPTTGADS